MADHEVDVVVVGMGPGGEEVASKLAKAGLEVVGADERLLGGECPYWGCVPSKMMIRASDALAEARRVDSLAGQVSVTPDWSPVAKRIRAEATDNWDDRVAVERFERAGGTFVRAHGRLVAADRVEIGGETYRARRAVVVNAGTTPAVPPIDGLAGTPFWTNHEAIEAETLPTSIVVLGGGAIGAELAQVFVRFGVQVTVVEALDRLLALDEPEAGAVLADVFRRDGIDVRTGVSAERVEHGDSGFTVHLADGGSVTGRGLLVATGRKVDLAAVGLDTVGADPKGRSVEVDGHCRVSTEGGTVYAVGDITGKGAFTHMSMYQAGVVVEHLLAESGTAREADYRAVPHVTFTDPEVGGVGLTEKAARDKGIDVRVGSTEMPSVARGFIHGPGNDGFVKLVADAERDVLVGGAAMGPAGGEVLGALVVAVRAEVPLGTLRDTIWAYPTFHRGIGDALRELG